MGAADSVRRGPVYSFHLVSPQVIDDRPIRADGVGIEIGLFPNGCEPAAGAPGHEHDLDARRPRSLKGVQGAGAEPEILPNECAVKVTGDQSNHAVTASFPRR